MRRMFAAGFCAVVCWLMAQQAAAQSPSIVNSPHNLSVMGPGNVRASSEQQICIFCHTPHNATPVQPLWNRTAPVSAYKPYTSNSLQAAPGQPTGSSKLCLSCHDGTIALGNVVSRNQPISMAGGMTTLPPGKSNLGTDLSDDHPVSFRYDSELAGKNPKLKSPSAISRTTRLDANQELQCTSCHEPHDNRFGKFLVADNLASQLCNSCHQQGYTTIAAHTDCNACHQSHTAPSGPYLLRGATVTATCTASNCHGSQASQPRLNIAADLAKANKHDTNSPVNQTNHIPNDTVCTDCHDPHTMANASAAGAPAISPRLGRIDGINASGSKVSPASNEYEVCFKCHGDNATSQVTVKARQITQANKRLQFASSAVSFHPVEAAGKNTNVPSLLPPWTTSSTMYCSDCHASNSSPAGGGTGARGPHGSANTGLLVANYTTTDRTGESLSAYALCYKCHDRNSILGDQSFRAHSRHIDRARTPCSVCHDPHGIAASQGTPTNNAHLINFDSTVVTPNNGVIRYTRTGPGQGTCTLTCHNRKHTDSNY